MGNASIKTVRIDTLQKCTSMDFEIKIINKGYDNVNLNLQRILQQRKNIAINALSNRCSHESAIEMIELLNNDIRELLGINF